MPRRLPVELVVVAQLPGEHRRARPHAAEAERAAEKEEGAGEGFEGEGVGVGVSGAGDAGAAVVGLDDPDEPLRQQVKAAVNEIVTRELEERLAHGA